MTVSGSEPVRIAVFGAGRIGQVHVANLSTRVPGVSVSAVVDVRRDAAAALASKHGVRVATDDVDAVLNDREIDAVLIASATDTHGVLIRGAAAAGKHIFCEKPIDTTIRAIDLSLEAVDRAGVRFQVGFNRRFDPSFRRVHDFVRAGEAGTPHLVRITSRDPQPPPAGYFTGDLGIFPDMTIHDFDLARFLMGAAKGADEVVEVFATGASLVSAVDGGSGEMDTAVCVLTFASGAIATIDNSRRAVYGYDQRIEVFGSGGMVAAGNVTPDSHVVSNASGIRSAVPHFFFIERYADAYANELIAFVQAVKSGSATPVTGHDGRMAVVLAMAAQQSVRLGRPVRTSEVV
ncbi:MAG: inositol 2-dehydrogenase [Chloroflexi bacterium]|nr:inositol 2-dehydrogenase [Chloroflexota bacterium]